MATAKTATKAKRKPAPEPEPDEVEDELEETEDELEELEDDEAAEAAPRKKKSADDEVVFGASDLAALLSKKTSKTITARDLRTLLRKMARSGRINREITPGNRTRYSWSGPNDAEVKAIVKAVMGGEIEEGKKEALAKLKEQKAAKQAEKAKLAAKKAKKAKAAEVEEEDEEDEDE